jgi:hypothetical protein
LLLSQQPSAEVRAVLLTAAFSSALLGFGLGIFRETADHVTIQDSK